MKGVARLLAIAGVLAGGGLSVKCRAAQHHERGRRCHPGVLDAAGGCRKCQRHAELQLQARRHADRPAAADCHQARR